MTLIALSVAGLLLGFAAFAAFGMPWILMGNRAFDDFRQRRDQQMLAGVLGFAAVMAASLPLIHAALASAAPQLQVFAQTVLGVPERFWS